MVPVAGFKVSLPADGATLRRNVEHALSLGLPDLKQAAPRSDALAIVANGPSARAFDFAGYRGETMAINGSIRLFGDQGPTWWAACDPQALVADLLPAHLPVATTYLVASHCHPALFERLANRNVILWHLDDLACWDLVAEREPIMTAPTITICALEVAERLGFGPIHTWGWDACYMDGLNHAVPQEHCGDGNCDNEVDGVEYRTTKSWMFEAWQACEKLEMFPRDLTVHGDGMIGAMLRCRGLLPPAPKTVQPLCALEHA